MGETCKSIFEIGRCYYVIAWLPALLTVLSELIRRSVDERGRDTGIPRPREPENSIPYIKSAPELIRLIVPMYVRFPNEFEIWQQHHQEPA